MSSIRRTNPIQYTSRTFLTVLNDINNDPELRDKPEWFKRMVAGSHDVLSEYENAIANQSFLRTAFTREAVSDLLALIDYYLSPKHTSSGELLFHINPDTIIYPKIVTRANLVARSSGTSTISSKKFESRADASLVPISEGFLTDFATNDQLTVLRSYTTGEKVRVQSDNTLPIPLEEDTDYYVIRVSATKILLAETQIDSYRNEFIELTSDGVGNHTIQVYSVKVQAYQQESKNTQIIGQSDGITEWQKFDLPDLDIIEDTLLIIINGDTWFKRDTLVNSIFTNKHFVHRYKTDGSSYIMFGNGVYGKIPENFNIFADYAIGGGSDSNISVVNRISVYAGSDADINGVTNPSNFTGGSEAENLESAKITGPMLLKSRDRFITVEDGLSLIYNFGGVARATIIKNFYGLLSAKIPIVPSGGGFPSEGLKTNIQNLLISRSILESVDVRCTDPNYTDIIPVVQIKPLSGFLFANIKPFVILALRLLFFEVTSEIILEYQQNGIQSATTYINNKWTTSFAEADYSQIERLIVNVEPTNFGKTFQESSVVSYIDTYVNGVDYLNWITPVFPIVLADDFISSDDVIDGNITEII